MQLATVRGDQPWVCTVYFVFLDGAIYWLSYPDRRHSLELSDNPNIAVTIPIKFDKPVIGVQVAGTAELEADTQTIEAVMKKYVSKYGAGKDFHNNYVSGSNKHVMYKMKFTETVLFDEVNFPEQGRVVVP